MQPDTPQGRQVRIAAVGDLHVSDGSRGGLFDVLSGVNRDADYLVLCGDLTNSGKPDQMRLLVEELRGVEIPVIAVLGNHDHEAGCEEELDAILKGGGVHVLDGDGVTLDGVGFAGTKGFVGGFGRHSLAPFGERTLKAFVQNAIDEALRLENAVRNLHSELKIVVMHYSPIVETVRGEPEEIYPFLGSTRFLAPIETHGASVVFHGHAHRGSPEGRTPAGVPVYNVALPVLRANGLTLRLWSAPAPDRRAARHLAAS